MLDRYKCDICEKVIKNKMILQKHYKLMHGGSRKVHHCDICAKSFSLQNYLKRHIHIVHDGFKDFNCDKCGYAFSTKANLDTHRKKINVNKKFYLK